MILTSFLVESCNVLHLPLSVSSKLTCEFPFVQFQHQSLIMFRYMFDEPSSYLDVKQRLRAANAIRSLVRDDDYIICVEHDLSVLDYLSDFICVLYGKPAVYGVVTLPASVREGINIFLDGNIPTENLRFREESLQFRIADTAEDYMIDKQRAYKLVIARMTRLSGN